MQGYQLKNEGSSFPAGDVRLNFIVEEDGSLTSISIIKDIGYGAGTEAERLLKISPKWLPATKDGIPVRFPYTLSINVNVQLN